VRNRSRYSRPHTEHFQLPTRKWVDRTSFQEITFTDAFGETLNKKFVGTLNTAKPARKLMTIEEALEHPDAYQALIESNCMRAVAQLARNDLIATHPLQVDRIMHLWFVRWWAMLRLSLFDAIKMEADKLNVFEALELVYEAYPQFFPDRVK
jgi:hypothetical protein